MPGQRLVANLSNPKLGRAEWAFLALLLIFAAVLGLRGESTRDRVVKVETVVEERRVNVPCETDAQCQALLKRLLASVSPKDREKLLGIPALRRAVEERAAPPAPLAHIHRGPLPHRSPLPHVTVQRPRVVPQAPRSPVPVPRPAPVPPRPPAPVAPRRPAPPAKKAPAPLVPPLLCLDKDKSCPKGPAGLPLPRVAPCTPKSVVLCVLGR